MCLQEMKNTVEWIYNRNMEEQAMEKVYQESVEEQNPVTEALERARLKSDNDDVVKNIIDICDRYYGDETQCETEKGDKE